MKSLKLALDLCREVSRQLDEIGHHTPEGGVDCLAYADEETAAIRLVAEEAAKLGARVFEDEAGNVSIVKEGTNPKLRAVMGGSHLDAVPQGGQYDGRAGVLIELAILKMMHEENIELQHDYVMQIFRAEESPRFGKALLGSGFATGRAKTSDFERKSFGDGETLAEAMKSQGAKVESLKSKVEAGEPLLPIKHIGGFREMHIEQANAVRDNERELGVVTGIRGNVRADIRYLGRAGHTGGEPQYSVAPSGDLKEVRSESSRGMARLIVNAEDLAEEIALAGRDIVFSAPVIQTPESSSTKICDDCYVRLEVRSTDPSVLEETKSFIEEQARAIAEKRGLILDEDSFNVSLSPSVPELSKKMIDHLARSAMEMQISTIKIPSGAGHDAMNMALAGVKTSMYFIPHNGLSHRPDENMVLNEGDDPFDISSPFAKAVLAMNHATATYKPCQKPMYVRTQSFVDALQERGAVEWEFEA